MDSIYIGGLFEETVSYDSCAHLNTVVDNVKNCYQLVVAYYVTCIAEKTPKRKADDVICQICKPKKIGKNKRIHVCHSRICSGKKNKRVHACLECAFFGCLDLCEFGKKDGAISHMEAHAVENKHYFALNINHGFVFCFRCNDYVYNKTFEEILSAYQLEARKINGSPCYLPYKPKVEDIAELRGNHKIIKMSDETFFGLRGIYNHGNTCYLNCILQIFLHNPIMIDFFFSDKHKCWKNNSDPCLICEMFILFQDFHRGIMRPYVPLNILTQLQKLGANTEGRCLLLKDILANQPQDTNHMYEDIVTGLMLSCQETHETFNCNCFIHKIFYGIFEISKECLCGAKSSTLDHFNIISLDINNSDSLVKSLKKKYFEPEVINDYTCSTCEQTNQTSSKLRIEKLPAVICFHKNWYYFNDKRILTEVDSEFSFEEWIDMSDYLNSKDIKLSNGGQHISFSLKNRYYLFGVVVRLPGEKKKDLNSGHYISYVKHKRDLWFKISDELIYETDLEQILKCKPLLLFYYKQM